MPPGRQLAEREWTFSEVEYLGDGVHGVEVKAPFIGNFVLELWLSNEQVGTALQVVASCPPCRMQGGKLAGLINMTSQGDGHGCDCGCERGQFLVGIGDGEVCQTCERGTYAPTGGLHPTCTPCPPLSTTASNGSTTLSQCLCQEGFYNSQLDGGVECVACPLGTTCNGIGNSIQTLELTQGFWRLLSTSSEVQLCPDAFTGCATNAIGCCSASHSSCQGGTDPAKYCRPGITGPFCRLCSEVDSRPHYFVEASALKGAECKACDDIMAVVVGGVLAILVAVFGVGALIRAKYKRLQPSTQKAIYRVWKACSPQNKLKLVFSFYLLVILLPKVYGVTLPAELNELLSRFAVAITLGLAQLATILSCMRLTGYREQLLFWLLMPPTLIALILLGGCLKLVTDRHSSFTKLLKLSAPWILRVLFVVYPLVTNAAFEAFSCYTVDGTGGYLISDVQVGSLPHPINCRRVLSD